MLLQYDDIDYSWVQGGKFSLDEIDDFVVLLDAFVKLIFFELEICVLFLRLHEIVYIIGCMENLGRNKK